jgi:RNA polymerase sigma factor for flagellar operon FliA
MKAYAVKKAVQRPERDRLIAEHVGMAKRIALRLARKVPAWMNRDDLIATAMLGLAEAADRFDSTRGEPFVAFAEKRIRGAVLDELRRGDILPRRVRVRARRVGEKIRELEQDLGRRPEDEEIAGALGVSTMEYRDELEALVHVGFVELDSRDHLACNATLERDSPLEIAERREEEERLRWGLSCLNQRDATVLSLYYVEELTYAEIGTVLGVSESRVCQLHSRALLRLRAELDFGEEKVKHGKRAL